MQQIKQYFRISNLIVLHLSGKLDADAKTVLDEWVNADARNARILNSIVDDASLAKALQEIASIDTESALFTIRGKITKAKADGSSDKADRPQEYNIIRLWAKVAIAAAAVAVITSGMWLYHSRKSIINSNIEITAKNDIAPGTSKATITLANGKVIHLSSSKTGIVIGNDLRYNDHTVVRYASWSQSSGSEGVEKREQSITGPISVHSPRSKEHLTVGTPRGGTYQVILSDGTKVWLNAASTLRFPSDFTGSARRVVELSGEGYFEVSKDKKHPFIVQTDLQSVEVLGTHFNINSYKDEMVTRTTLIEGSVLVSSLLSARVKGLSSRENAKDPGPSYPQDDKGARGKDLEDNNLILKPGQQSVLAGNGIKIKKVDTEGTIAWKNGLFYYNNTPMENVMRQISRWYDVEIEYESVELKNKILSGSVSRYDKVSKILSAIEYLEAARFKIEGRKITVSKYD